jgi:hypothetical protein
MKYISLLDLVDYEVNKLSHVCAYLSYCFMIGKYKRKTEQLWTTEVANKVLLIFQEDRKIRYSRPF